MRSRSIITATMSGAALALSVWNLLRVRRSDRARRELLEGVAGSAAATFRILKSMTVQVAPVAKEAGIRANLNALKAEVQDKRGEPGALDGAENATPGAPLGSSINA